VHFSFLCPLSSFLADLLPSQTRLPYPSVRLSLCLSLLHPRTHLLPPHRSFFSVNHLHLHLLSLPLPFPGSFKYHPSPGTAAGGLGSAGKVKLKGFSWFVEVDQVRSSRLCLVVFAADHQPCMLPPSSSFLPASSHLLLLPPSFTSSAGPLHPRGR
jgi:hypothetical protein